MNLIVSTQGKRSAILLAAALLAGCGGSDPSSDPARRIGASLQAAAQCPGISLAGRQNLVYVSAEGGDEATCGHAIVTACKRIAQGIANCNGPACSVLVRHGLYATTSSIPLRNAVNLHGSCRFDGEPDLKYRTVILASPAPGTAAITGDGINDPTLLSGVMVLGKDETAPGAASVAMAISASGGLTLANVALVAGRGGDGAPGSSAAGGGNGGNGSLPSRLIVTDCFSDCTCTPVAGGKPGIPSGNVAGGIPGGPGSNGCGCAPRTENDPGLGGPGLAGGAGSCAVAGGRANILTEGQRAFHGQAWLPTSGSAGSPGTGGSGGGGGGAGGISANAIFGPSPLEFDRAACRPAFRASVMNCEFIDDWAHMDLKSPGTGRRTSVAACQGKLAGRDLSGARLAGVNLAGASLDGASFAGAEPSQAIFDGASLRCAALGAGAPRCADPGGGVLRLPVRAVQGSRQPPPARHLPSRAGRRRSHLHYRRR